MNTTIIYTPARIDIYADGNYVSTISSASGIPFPIDETECIDAFVPNDIKGSFSEFIGERKYNELQEPCLLETDDHLIILNNGETINIDLQDLFFDIILPMVKNIDTIQQQAGFFEMNMSQKNAAENYLLSCLKEISVHQEPTVLCIPVFAWFNYATLDESEVDYNDISTYTEIPGSLIWNDSLQLIIDKLPEHFKENVPERTFIRSTIVRKTINLLKS